MQIIYLGEELDATKEHQLFTENVFGFNVNIKYTEDSWYPVKNVIAYNCTEVHHMWSLDYMGGASIAFESDILGTGFTRVIDTIESINIELSDKVYDVYMCSTE